MRLASHDVLVVDVPLDRPFMGVADMRHVVLRLRSDDGVEGLGWAGWFDPTLIPALATAVDAIAGGLIGADPTNIRDLMAKVGRQVGYWGPGLTRYVRRSSTSPYTTSPPNRRALGGCLPRSARPYRVRADLCQPVPVARLRPQCLAPECRSAGCRRLERHEVPHRCQPPRIRRSGARQGRPSSRSVPTSTIMVDINQGWDHRPNQGGRSSARALSACLARGSDRSSRHRRLSTSGGQIGIPITHGEYHFDTEPFGRIVAVRAADVVMIDAHHVGGILAWLRAGDGCDVGASSRGHAPEPGDRCPLAADRARTVRRWSTWTGR